MATNTSKLKVSELDFDTIKDNLKAFLKDQNEFQDYDFEASSISLLLDVLAYNTHYNAFYANMIANELFLGSATLKDSVVSIAKQIGYLPRSPKGSKATISMKFYPPDRPAVITIPKYSQFTASVNNVSYVFCSNTSYSVLPSDSGEYTIDEMGLVQGIPVIHRYTVDSSIGDQRFILPNSNTDVTTLTVSIRTSSAESNSFIYTLANDITQVTSESNVYFLEAINEGKYEVLFGDGVTGRAVSDGNIITLTSLVCDGSLTNGANTFIPSGPVGGYSNVSVSTITKAAAGAEADTIDSIKFNAPRNYEAQNRAVTIGDYVRLLQRDFPDAESVVSWGGEDNDPPVYGKVFIAIKPKTGLALSTSTKNLIRDSVLGPRQVVSVQVEVLDPDYTFLEVDTTVRYDSRKTTFSAQQLGALVRGTISSYNQNELGVFEYQFRYSKLTKQIDETEGSINSSLTTVYLKKKFTPTPDAITAYTLSYNNEILHPFDGYIGAMTSNQFSHRDSLGNVRSGCVLEDLDGVMRVVRYVGPNKTLILDSVGTVNYTTGKISLVKFRPLSVVGDELSLIAKPATNDITPVRDQILVIEDEDIEVIMIDDASSGSTSADIGISRSSTRVSSNTAVLLSNISY